MKQYRDLVTQILTYGEDRGDRTGVGTRGIFGHQMVFDLEEGFPLLGLKKTHWRSILVELIWFLRGDINVNFLHEYGVTIWDEWADKNGDLGPVYGKQWRSWPGTGARMNGEGQLERETIDQLQNVIDQIKNNPFSRRHIVTAWNPSEVDDMALPPCHTMFQFYVSTDGKLSCQLYQRSGDVFLGVPFNIASYALLTHLVAEVTGLKVGKFVHTLGDAHIYRNHLDFCGEMLARTDRPLPTIELNPDLHLMGHLNNLMPHDVELRGYDPHPAIKAQVAV